MITQAWILKRLRSKMTTGTEGISHLELKGGYGGKAACDLVKILVYLPDTHSKKQLQPYFDEAEG